ncbi:pitrilysin family protein [Seonamhaeicola sp. ML3]|uniref:M16 family metallopeptidase n=1 Tax=Seonamhaeicola sp. ML3 TaxID=2937786 RepID=UPI0020104822|nr:insulinase family protein [Seonamhaeicola sp. ML3]
MKHFLAFCFLSISMLLSAQETNKAITTYNLESEIPKDTTALRGQLPNGLKYFIKENDRPKETVYIRLIVKAGFLQEDEKQHGLAHLLEHMGFNGTKNFKKDKLIKYLESIGVKFGMDLNASTGQNQTVYKLKVPTKNLKQVDKAFQILEDWAHNMLLKDDAIDDERPVIVEELRGMRGSGQRVGDEIRSFLYKGMRQLEFFELDKQVENIETFIYDELRRYYTEWYRPNLMGIVVAGDIDAAYVEDKIKTHFSALTNPVNEKQLKTFDTVPYYNKTRVKVITDKEKTLTSIRLRFFDKYPKRRQNTLMKHRKEGIVKSIMQRIINRRLDELSNSEQPPFIGAGVGISSTLSKYHYNFSIGASAKESEIEKTLKHMVLELERIKRFGFSEEELSDIKKDMLASNESFIESKDDWYSGSYLRLLEQEFSGDWVLYSKDWKYAFDKAIIPEITVKDIETLFNTYYHKDNRALIVTAPEKEGFVLPTNEALLSVLSTAEKDSTLTPYIPKILKNELLKEIRPKGQIVHEEDGAHGIKKIELSNGAKVFYKKTDFDKEKISFKAFSYGGTSLLNDEEIKRVGHMEIVNVCGIGGYKPHELKRVLDGKMVNVSPFVSSYEEGLRGGGRVEDLETLFKLIYLVFTEVNYDETMYLNYVDKIKAVLKNRKLSPRNEFSSAISKLKNKDNPRYFDINEGDNMEKLLDSVPYKDLYKTYTKRFENAGDFNFFFVGDFDEDILKDFVEKYIASLPSTEERENYKLTTFKNILSGERVEVRKGLEDKATLKIEFLKEAKHIKNEDKALNIFGNIFQTHLRDKIREEKGGVYSVSAGLRHIGRPYSRYTGSITFSCAPDNVESLENESLAVLQELIKKGVSKKEVEGVKKNWVLNRKKGLETNSFWLNHMYNKVYWKKTFDDGIDGYEENLDNITTKLVNRVAKKYIEDPSLIAKLLPELKEEVKN